VLDYSGKEEEEKKDGYTEVDHTDETTMIFVILSQASWFSF
jgi:hypothetical protein